ncbi:sarcosine oxidase subunit gamma (plasmid) [Salipiger sp. CCB-MM3]|uniref:sarcosine oxidase subunit gamma n=1 Tax=Salipiger sp. CCB-MM3 TaxID=1792508 RepID=UPI00080A9655|nr:sarcosine oxidase subunit gamma [Salipiger sp. CCB-MM3]ANT63212.1 sarcosine oxidase subunit gamma [Salipiger sp. CCB-MM3]
MADLIPLTALGAEAPRRASFAALTLTERPDIALASLALRKGGTAPQVFGLALPGPGGMVTSGGTAAFWTGPGQWMVMADERAEEDFAAALCAAAPGCSVTEQTDGWVAIEMDCRTPIAAERFLERLVNLPPEALAPGRATRSMLHHMAVYMLRHSETRLLIWGMRSAADSLWHALESAAARLTAD